MTWITFTSAKRVVFDLHLSWDQSHPAGEDPPSGGLFFTLKYIHTGYLWTPQSCEATVCVWHTNSLRVIVTWRRVLHVALLHLLLRLVYAQSLDVLAAQWAQSGRRRAWFLSTCHHGVVERGWVITAGLYHQSPQSPGFLSLSMLNVNETAAQGAPLTLGDHCAYWLTSSKSTIGPHQTIHPRPHRYLAVTDTGRYHLPV